MAIPASDPIKGSKYRDSSELLAGHHSGRISVPEIARQIGNWAAGGVLDVKARDHAGYTPRPTVDHHTARLPRMGAQLRNARWHWTSEATRGNGIELMSV
jgi:hypothetical protein